MKPKGQKISRRSFISSAASLTAGLSLSKKLWGAPAYLPNLLNSNTPIRGVQLGLITYSFRALKDQSAEATLQYVLDCGIGAIELMGGTAESFLGKPQNKIDRRLFYRLTRKEKNNKLNSDEKKQLDDLNKQKASFEKEVIQWSERRNIDDFEKLRKMYDAAGVKIYAFKPDYLLNKGNSDAHINYAMQAGKKLGASHVTLELPKDSNHSLKLGKMAEKNGIKVAYHGHEQQHAQWWDTALTQSDYNAMNMDLGHYTAAGNTDALQLIQEKHQHLLSMHVKDRQNPKNGKRNLPFGKGDTPIVEALQLMRDKKYSFPATIEYEYRTPKDSSVIEEIKKCVAYCKNVLES